MNKIARRTITFIATSALLVNAVAPVFADTTLTESGNGASSNNNVTVNNSNATSLIQTNTASVTNNVNSSSNTGGNNASDNTGGNTGISTGNATSKANVSTAVNMNQAVVPGCNCNSDNKVVITGNGADSYNKANLDNQNAITLAQTNSADVTNNVKTDAKTGQNDANYNTGGTTEIGTGNATSVANVSTQANANVAQVGNGAGNGGSTQLIEDGNGAHSKNHIDFDNSNATSLIQSNEAYVVNDVNAKADTGKNDANYNTGGNTGIGTGNAYATATVDTMANFNAANIDCGCDSTVKAVESGNGYDAYDKINADLSNATTVDQGGSFDVSNPVDAKAKTGDNDTNYNTGATSYVDPVLNFTGDAWSGTDVSTSGNANVFGSVPTITMPEFNLGGNSFSFDFNFDFFGQQS